MIHDTWSDVREGDVLAWETGEGVDLYLALRFEWVRIEGGEARIVRLLKLDTGEQVPYGAPPGEALWQYYCRKWAP